MGSHGFLRTIHAELVKSCSTWWHYLARGSNAAEAVSKQVKQACEGAVAMADRRRRGCRLLGPSSNFVGAERHAIAG